MDVREKQPNEKRLIDADALMDVIRQHEYRLATKQGSIDYGMFTLGIQQAVDEQQTIDAVPVARCAQCKHFKRNLENDTYCSSVNGLTDPQEDDFCSYGERKDGDK